MTCAEVVGHLGVDGCLGVVVVFPTGNTFTSSQSVVGDLELMSRRYVAAAFPISMMTVSHTLCQYNKVLRSSQNFELRVISIQEGGLEDLSQVEVENLVAFSLPLVGSTFFCTSYFLFGKLGLEKHFDLLRRVAYESYLLWASLSKSLKKDTETFGVTQAVLNILLLSQSGRTSREISEIVGISHRLVERELDKFKKVMSAENKLDAIQKAQIFRII